MFFSRILLDHLLIYWGISFSLLAFDTLTLKNWEYYKLRFPVVPDNWKNIFKIILKNQFLISFPVFYMFDTFKEENLLVFENLYKLPATVLIFEFIFYHLHFLFHIHPIFLKFHKQHHKWITPMAIATLYCHPLENLLLNTVPIILSAKITQLGTSAFRFWHAFALINSMILSHGSYNIKLNKKIHDLHHKEFACNYGVLGIFDRFYGTFKK